MPVHSARRAPGGPEIVAGVATTGRIGGAKATQGERAAQGSFILFCQTALRLVPIVTSGAGMEKFLHSVAFVFMGLVVIAGTVATVWLA